MAETYVSEFRMALQMWPAATFAAGHGCHAGNPVEQGYGALDPAINRDHTLTIAYTRTRRNRLHERRGGGRISRSLGWK